MILIFVACLGFFFSLICLNSTLDITTQVTGFSKQEPLKFEHCFMYLSAKTSLFHYWVFFCCFLFLPLASSRSASGSYSYF